MGLLRYFLLSIAMSQHSIASENIPDQYPQSVLYSKPSEFIPNVFSAIGATAPPTYENSGHNNNLSFVVTAEGVVVINSGASFSLAEAMHREIKLVTDKPVKLVINENGQGHAMLGNSYWAELGIDILAHEDAASGVRNIIIMKAGGLEVGPILMGMKNKAHIVTPSITARGLLNMAAIAGTPVTEYE